MGIRKPDVSGYQLVERRSDVKWSIIITDMIHICTITNYIIPLLTGGTLFLSVPSINTEFNTQKKDDHRGLYSLDDRITV